jgi:hypothetical protein
MKKLLGIVVISFLSINISFAEDLNLDSYKQFRQSLDQLFYKLDKSKRFFCSDNMKKSLGSDAVLRCNVYENLIKDLDKNITAISYNKTNFFYAFINYYPSVDGNSAFDDYYYPFLTNKECEKYKSLYIQIDHNPKNCTKINLIIN